MSQSDLATTLVPASSTEGRWLVLESVATRVTREMSDWAGRGGELSLQGGHPDRKIEGPCTPDISLTSPHLTSTLTWLLLRHGSDGDIGRDPLQQLLHVGPLYGGRPRPGACSLAQTASVWLSLAQHNLRFYCSHQLPSPA